MIAGQGPPAGWTGKLWALKQGIAAAAARISPDYLLLTDADIVHAPDTLTLASRPNHCAGARVLTSLMAKLRCESFAERSHVPAFIYFFQMLYPFAWVDRADASTAAAAGGCMLVRTDALASAGGIDSDPQRADRRLLARRQAQGRRRRSGSASPSACAASGLMRQFADIRRMIARSAYAQLRYSPLLLAGTTAGMALTFLAPPLLAIFAQGWPRYLGTGGLAGDGRVVRADAALLPAVAAVGLALPAIALLYMTYTARFRLPA